MEHFESKDSYSRIATTHCPVFAVKGFFIVISS
jgi:hypothetical protein